MDANRRQFPWLAAAALASLVASISAVPQTPKFAPAYCARMRFNCQRQAGHVCCRFPLPPEDGDEAGLARTKHASAAGVVRIRPIRLPARPEVPAAEAKNGQKEEVPVQKAGQKKPSKPSPNMRHRPGGIVHMMKRKRPQVKQAPPSKPLTTKHTLASAARRKKKKPRICQRLVVNCKSSPEHRCCQFQEEEKKLDAVVEPAYGEEEPQDLDEDVPKLEMPPTPLPTTAETTTTAKPTPGPTKKKKMSMVDMLRRKNRPKSGVIGSRRPPHAVVKTTTTTIGTSTTATTTTTTTTTMMTYAETNRPATTTPSLSETPIDLTVESLKNADFNVVKVDKKQGEDVVQEEVERKKVEPSKAEKVAVDSPQKKHPDPTSPSPAPTSPPSTPAPIPAVESNVVSIAKPSIGGKGANEVPAAVPIAGWVSSVEPVKPYDHLPVEASPLLPAEPKMDDPAVSVVHQKIPVECFKGDFDCKSEGATHMCCAYM